MRKHNLTVPDFLNVKIDGDDYDGDNGFDDDDNEDGGLCRMQMMKKEDDDGECDDDDDEEGADDDDDDATDDDDDAGDCERILLRILRKAWQQLLVAAKDKHWQEPPSPNF